MLGYLSFVAIFPFTLAIAGKYAKSKSSKEITKKRKFLVLIPAYKEDRVIVQTAMNSLQQDYPKNLYDVVVIADQLKNYTIEKLNQIDVFVDKVSFEKSTKVKALNHAIEKYLDKSYGGVVILDADNLMDIQFLNYMNKGLESNMLAIQGQRRAKNIDTSMAFLDGASEDINNHIYCKGAYQLGLSSRLSGSGMAFIPHILKNALRESNAYGGFDKELELTLTSREIQIHYCEKAIILDEKTREKESFTHQRTRWIQAQYKYFLHHLKKGLWNGIRNRKFDYVIKVLILSLPPRLLIPLILLASGVFQFLITGLSEVTWLLWILMTISISSYLIAIPKCYLSKKHISHWKNIIGALIQTLKALSNLSKAKTSFLHTPHGVLPPKN